METSAIQTDVENEVKAKPNPRDELIASIAERVNQERADELKANEPEKPEEAKEPEIEEPEIKEPESKEPEEPKEPEIKGPEFVKIKVDGEEKEVPKDKIFDAGIRALQKESSADKRLEEATRLLREIEQKYVQPQQTTPSQEWDDATVAYALEHGTEEQKAYAVKLLRGRDQATPEQIVQDATRRVLDTVDFQGSSEWFLNEYSDIAKDPYLFHLASVAENQARAAGDTRSRKELYKAIGDDLRKWKGGVTSTSLEQKKEQKSNIVNLPSASMKKAAPETPKPKSVSDVINDIRKARGQR